MAPVVNNNYANSFKLKTYKVLVSYINLMAYVLRVLYYNMLNTHNAKPYLTFNAYDLLHTMTL